ncbi:KEOPS complex subunit Cgi121 [Halapricum hydrolyticum]|uniref:KEOPS complex subunit Cgi121 n=1 Tax=Halapricum hydrolyticum TaxID=2979991 RepID=A0AAE3IEW7_9EURY|nr:KEOPS complex subunit Cgi121 [Halapricum hydrolyticum]MCU4719149.1 KEOPS complex subunit Cgi121 [Halapricum hydrolyticum]MCU4727339.1 KEOPS complex subunit Cgi121 [Halapricum hydrolyticum]
MEVIEATVTVADLDGFVAQLREIADEHSVAVQALDARYVVDREHLQRAVELADQAFERDDNIADDRSVEILLYAAGKRQINRALELGVEPGGCPAVIVVHDPDGSVDCERAAVEAVRSLPAVEPADTLGDYDERRVRDWFEVTDAELETGAALPALVRERVALLVVEK